MECKLQIVEPTGDVINELDYDIPLAVSNNDVIYRNHLYIGNYVYYIKPTGEIEDLTIKKPITKERIAEIKELWENKIKDIEKGLL